tara:strand:- start:7284 stop:8033 length:750 start_codon:yes stop_codon:yes gene_type:complete
MKTPEILGHDLARGGDLSAVQIVRGDEVAATLFLGDAYAIRPKLGFMHADVMDPDYLIRTEGAGRFRKERKHMDEIAEAGIDKGFDLSIINPMLCGAVVVFCHNDQLAKLLHHVDGQFDRYAACAWLKANPMPLANKHYRPDSEPYVHAWQRGYEPTGSLAELRRYVVASARRTLKTRFGHPTIKPPAVMDKIMANVAGHTVCDPFMGTGSTGVAAIRAGKRFYGIERNPRWFEAAVTRIAEAAEETAG